MEVALLKESAAKKCCGWNLRRVNGSHHILTKPGRTEAISVPIHANQTMGSGLQKHIMKMAGLTDADL